MKRDLAWPWPWVNCIWCLDIHKHQQTRMECIIIRWEARARTLVRQIAKSADYIRTWPDIWRHNLMTWHDIDLKFSQYVSNLSTRGYSKFRGDLPGFTRVIRFAKNHEGGVHSTPLQVRGLIWFSLSRRIECYICIMHVDLEVALSSRDLSSTVDFDFMRSSYTY